MIYEYILEYYSELVQSLYYGNDTESISFLFNQHSGN